MGGDAARVAVDLPVAGHRNPHGRLSAGFGRGHSLRHAHDGLPNRRLENISPKPRQNLRHRKCSLILLRYLSFMAHDDGLPMVASVQRRLIYS